MEDQLGIALVKEACRLCGGEVNDAIIMNRKLSKKNAKKVEELHGKVIGYAKEPCKDCKEAMTKGLLMIGVIEEKTEDEDNPWRSGHQWVIKKEKAEELFGENVAVQGAVFVDIKAAKQMGLPVYDLTPKGSA
jgi:hypothetical protein